MSNDTTYNLKLRHPEKARLKEVKIFLTVVKPALCRLVLNMKPDPKLSRQEYLDLLGIKKLSEVITWFGPYSEVMIIPKIGRVKKVGGTYEFEIRVWANENHCGNIWVSGPDGELADLLDRFPGLEIEGEFEDAYGAGAVQGHTKAYQMDLVEYNVRDEESWANEECAGYSEATKELLMAASYGELDLARLRRLLGQGADVNATRDGSDFLLSLQFSSNWDYDTKDPKDLARRLSLILKAGWRYKNDDETMRKALFRYANNLRHEEKARPVCIQMAAMLLGRKPRKHEDVGQLFFDSLRVRDVSGMLAAMYLGVDIREVSLGLSKKNRAWLRKAGFCSEGMDCAREAVTQSGSSEAM